MGVCCVEGCESGDSEDVTYFPFPIKPALVKKWRKAIVTTTKIHQDSKICSRHFQKDDYELIRGKLRLKARVVPSVFDKRDSSPPKSPQVQHSNKDEEKQDGGQQKTKGSPSKKFPIPQFSLQEGVARDYQLIDDHEERWSIECVPEILDEESDCQSESEIHNNDIEDIIAPYHIKQNKQLAQLMKKQEEEAKKRLEKEAETQSHRRDSNGNKQREGMIEVEVEPVSTSTKNSKVKKSKNNQKDDDDDDVVEIGGNNQRPKFIEISVDSRNKAADDSTRDDCLMLLENVQVDIDPSTLMLQDPEPEEEDKKKDDPISLLTSSDDDDVIIQEPHIDTVTVSSGEDDDDDDVPLVKLVKQNVKNEKNITRILWGNLVEYYCYQCSFTTLSKGDLAKHKLEHSKILLVCEICQFTSASKSQFARHKKRHKEEKRFKCHLCEYRARHNMALVYHMKSHEGVIVEAVKHIQDRLNKISDKTSDAKGYKCSLCRFKTDRKKDLIRHLRVCMESHKGHKCDQCAYVTKRKSDLKRHKLRKHNNMDCDDDNNDDDDD